MATSILLRFQRISKQSLAIILTAMLPLTAFSMSMLPYGQQQSSPAEQPATPIPPDQLEGLVSPIALYPDELLAQVLVASTYPLEIVQLAQWMQQNKNLKDKELVEAVKKQKWDPSIQALVSFPDIVKQLSSNIQWTADLGNAFLAQQSDVMDAVQRLRQQATNSGKLQSGPQQTVETKVVENKTVVVIEPTDPQVVYVPSYSPPAVWGEAAYPYPPIAYPTYPAAGYVATGLLSFTAGVALGAWGHGGWGHGGWGWGAGWGHNDININNNFVRNNNLNGSRTNIAGNRGNSTWQHNPQHRGGAPYANRQTADRFGGNTQAGQRASRANASRQAGNLGANRTPGANRAGAGGQRPGNLARTDFGGGAGNRIGNRQVQGSGGARSAFGGGSGGFDRASSARGRSSLSGGGRSFSGGGGRSFGGGGGRRGGGGGRRR